MPTKLVIGLQHGDEGKGRVVDDLCHYWADIVVRFQGGGNAGHTVYDEKGNKFVTHTLPVGVLNKDKINIITKGCVVNPIEVAGEIKFFNVESMKLKISGFAPLIEPVHLCLDKVKYQGKIGTTAKGIGPAYSSFYARDSILLKDLIYDYENSYSRINKNMDDFLSCTHMSEKTYEECYSIFQDYIHYLGDARKVLRKHILFDDNYLQEQYAIGKNILLEGAQGCGLSIHSENYPNVTSSSPTLGGAIIGTDLSHKQIDEVIGVTKAYKTKVGAGDFPSRCPEDVEAKLSKAGKEFGATTGRPRKCGWLDLDEITLACKQNGVDHIVLVKSDVFSTLPEKNIYCEGIVKEIENFEDVSLSDWKFRLFLTTIKMRTIVDKISFTTGPNRGEIIWGDKAPLL